jgi:hypothetical protein
MKQHITLEQFNELNDIQKVQLCKILKIPLKTHIITLKRFQQFIDKEHTLNICKSITIGKLIEFFECKNIKFSIDNRSDNEYYVMWQSDEISTTGTGKPELIDALWSEILKIIENI